MVPRGVRLRTGEAASPETANTLQRVFRLRAQLNSAPSEVGSKERRSATSGRTRS
jgi:hypothetical protein